MAHIEQRSPGRYVMKDLYKFELDRDTLNQRLSTLPVSVRPVSIKPRSALRRALSLSLDQSLYAFEESSTEKVDQRPVFLVLSREAIRNEEVDPTRGKAWVESGAVMVDTHYPETRSAIEDGFNFHMKNAITRDLSKVVSAYVGACMGITVRPNNGEVYFVLEEHSPKVEELARMIDRTAQSLGQESTLRISPVVGAEVEKVTKTAYEHFREASEKLEKLSLEISEDTHTRTLNTRLKEIAELIQQVRAYEIGLGMELETVGRTLKEAQERVAVRLTGREKTTRTEAEERPAAASASSGSKAQMTLI